MGGEEEVFVTPGEVLGKATELKAGKGAYVSANDRTVYASLTGFRSLTPPPEGSDDPRPTVEVKGHKAHGPVPEPGLVVIARVTKVMAKMASADIICVGPKSVREKFTGTIRQQDVRATEIDKVDMHSSFRPFLLTSVMVHMAVGSNMSFDRGPMCDDDSYKLDRNAVSGNRSSRAEKGGQESSDSPKSLDPDPKILLQELADCFVLPADYFQQLPRDLRLDLNDAAFDLSNGAVRDECGEELGETLLNISRAWEAADTSTSANLVSKLPLLAGSFTSKSKSALGKRLVSASRRFQSMGQYGQGKLLSARPVTEVDTEEPKQETRMLKNNIFPMQQFGDLQVELTPEKAYVVAVIGFIFGILSWQISQGIQSIPESSLEYANDSALLLAKSLRGALLALFYSSTVLSAFATFGLVLLGGQLKSKGK
ncbi:UNVERIFIED_CONTAM: Exosome complex component CSL4 [Sesamum calycinum]|uniref:Exosome complex component CSL4 n=1 Tax=Sesamum calycinum TaxID=2727403 RepID=A0AAW2L3C8_9LAMI